MRAPFQVEQSLTKPCCMRMPPSTLHPSALPPRACDATQQRLPRPARPPLRTRWPPPRLPRCGRLAPCASSASVLGQLYFAASAPTTTRRTASRRLPPAAAVGPPVAPPRTSGTSVSGRASRGGGGQRERERERERAASALLSVCLKIFARSKQRRKFAVMTGRVSHLSWGLRSSGFGM